MNAIKITKTWEELKVMEDNDLKVFWPPGASSPYINSQASYTYDKCVATTQDFIEAIGFDSLSDEDDGLTYTLEVEYPF